VLVPVEHPIDVSEVFDLGERGRQPLERG
jgi:hypothetical protein